MSVLTGGEAVVKMLQAHQVKYAFGMGGFQGLPYYGALADQNQIKHIVIRDEKDGAFAADAYARSTGRPAVVDGTLGPGATNLVSGAAESFSASIPLILITSDANRAFARRGATQEIDQVSILRPVVKEYFDVAEIGRIPEFVRRAFSAATGGRPGPVLLNIPENVFHGQYDFEDSAFYMNPGTSAIGQLRVRGDRAAIQRATELLASASKPVMIVGGGVHLSHAYDEIKELAESLGVPVAYSISGKGVYSDTEELCLGLCGRYSRYANKFIGDADVLLVVGCKLGEIATNRWSIINSTTKIIHVDIDPQEIGKHYRVEVGIWGDARATLEEMNEAAKSTARDFSERRSSILSAIASARDTWWNEAERIYKSDESPIVVARLLYEMQQVCPKDTVFVADGGFAAHWSALLYNCESSGRTYIADRGQAAIGYGVPGAIGAKLADRTRPVVALCGDNGFAMSAAELETAVREKLNILFVIVNNKALGYVKALQHVVYGGKYISVDFEEVDYVALAVSLGCRGLRVDRPSELMKALQEGLRSANDVPFVLDVRTTTDPAKMLPGVDSRAKSA